MLSIGWFGRRVDEIHTHDEIHIGKSTRKSYNRITDRCVIISGVKHQTNLAGSNIHVIYSIT